MAIRTPLPRFAPALGICVALSLGCDAGPGASAPPELSARETEPAEVTVSGTYRVAGVTEELEGGATRPIDGTIVLTQDGDGYTASFQLSTLYPSPSGQHRAAVIGKGEGAVRGGDLDGKAHTQVVVAAVPGVDTDFAFAPRTVMARIESASKATIQADGKLVIEIENAAAEGERYRPTRTRLSGERIAAARPDEAPPVGAAAEPPAVSD